jgi:hypothetical protein
VGCLTGWGLHWAVHVTDCIIVDDGAFCAIFWLVSVRVAALAASRSTAATPVLDDVLSENANCHAGGS